MPKHLSDLSIVEKNAFELMIQVISETPKQYNKNMKFLDSMIFDRFYKQNLGSQKSKQRDVGKSTSIPSLDFQGQIFQDHKPTGHIFKDLNYGDGYFIFQNPFRIEQAERWQRVFFDQIMDSYRDHILNKSYENPCKPSYLDAEELAFFNLILMCGNYFEVMAPYREIKDELKEAAENAGYNDEDKSSNNRRLGTEEDNNKSKDKSAGKTNNKKKNERSENKKTTDDTFGDSNRKKKRPGSMTSLDLNENKLLKSGEKESGKKSVMTNSPSKSVHRTKKHLPTISFFTSKKAQKMKAEKDKKRKKNKAWKAIKYLGNNLLFNQFNPYFYEYDEEVDNWSSFKRIEEYDIYGGLHKQFRAFIRKLIYDRNRNKNRKIDSNKVINILFPVKRSSMYEELAIPRIYYQLFTMKLIKMKLNHLKIYTRCFMTDEKDKIFMVIKALRQALEAEAEAQKLSKQVEIGFVDLGSLQPVDRYLRPILLKPRAVKDFTASENIPADENVQLIKNDAFNEKKIANLFRNVHVMTNNELRNHIEKISKKQKFLLREVYGLVRQRAVLRNQGKIEMNQNLDRRTWEAVYVYFTTFQYWTRRILPLYDSEKYRDMFPFLMRMAYQKAIGDTNQAMLIAENNLINHCFNTFKTIKFLQNFWGRMGLKPLMPWYPYERSGNSHVFKTYEVNENGDRSIFNDQERIGLVFKHIEKSICLEMLLNQKVIMDISPLHDPFLLIGQTKTQLFNQVHEKLDVDDDEDEDDILRQIEREKNQNTKLKIDVLLNLMSDEGLQSDFIGKSLSEECSFKLFRPFSFPIDKIKDYFGEKVAIYFLYIKTQSKSMLYTSFILVVLDFIRQQAFDTMLNYPQLEIERAKEIERLKGEGADISAYPPKLNYMIEKNWIILMAFVIMIWSTMFVNRWERVELMWNTKQGNDTEKVAKTERPFQNKSAYLRRDLASSNPNFRVDKVKDRAFRTMITFLITIALTIASILTTFIVFEFKLDLYKRFVKKEIQFILVTWIPVTLNIVFIAILKPFFEWVALKTVNFEKHQYREEFETSFIKKTFTFLSANYFISFVIIAFIKPYLGHFLPKDSPDTYIVESLEVCISTRDVKLMKCYGELNTQVRSIFIIIVVNSIFEIFVPKIKLIWRSFNTRLKRRRYIWGTADKMIIRESLKDDYMQSFDIDGSTMDLATPVIEYAFLSLFGLAFPLAFPILMGLEIAQIHTDKFKLFYLLRRPIPREATGIGFWKIILQVISNLSIVVNSAILVFTGNVFYSDDPELREEMQTIKTGDKFIHFCLLTFVFYAFKMLINQLTGSVPRKYRKVKQRQKIKMNLVFNKEKHDDSIYLSKCGLLPSDLSKKGRSNMYADCK